MNTALDHSWPEVRIGDFLRYLDERVELDDSAEYTTITVKRRHGGLEERERILGHQILTKKQFRLVPGAFIISRVQCWHKAYAIVPSDISPNMIASSNYDQFAISPEVDGRFFWWLSHSPYFTETIRSSASGVVIEKMVFDRDLWLDKKIPLPLVGEQRRIVARIEELAAKIKEARDLRKQTAEAAEALLKAHLNLLFGNPYGGIEGNLGIRQWQKIDAVVEDVADGPHITPAYVPEGIPFITVLNITSGRVHFGDHKFITLEDHRQFQQRAKAEKGDVLLSKDGTIGVPCLVDTDREFSFFVSVALIKPKRGVLDGEFLMWAIRAPYLQERIASRSRGDMIRHLVLREIRDLTIPVPPLPEQRQIVSELNQLEAEVNSLKRLHAETTIELDALMPSILDKAFRGEM